jgi:error-prone DNA polymerase
MVLIKQSPGTAKGMVFVTLEDEAGFFNLAFTPQVYRRHYRAVDQEPFLCVVGRLQRVNESHSILVKRVFEISRQVNLIDFDQSVRSESAAAAMALLKPRAYR